MTTPNNKSLPPLLAEAPLTAGRALLGGASSCDIEQSPLERLIAQSTSEQAAAASSFFSIEDPVSIPRTSEDVVSTPASSLLFTTVITLVAGTLCLLQVGLVWGSFLSNAWFETHLTITFDGTWSIFVVDQTLQKTSLASLLSILLGADQGGAAMILVLTCLICPCLCMILCPSWTFGDYQEAMRPSMHGNTGYNDILGFDPRAIVEHFLIRICFLAFFLLAIFDVGTSSLALENNHSEFLITNRTRGGIVCYTLGMACALMVVVMLRVVSQAPFQPSTREGAIESNSNSHYYTRQEHPRAPPDRAFQELHRPLLADDDMATAETGAAPNEIPSANDTGLPPWKNIIIYEVGILTLVLWIPALFLPLFRIRYDGLVASFMDEVSFEIPFYQVPSILLQRGNAAGTDLWILLALGVVLLLLVYVLPLATTMIAIGAWRSPDYSKAAWFYKAILRILQPCLCGPIFSLALLLALPSLKPLGNFILDSQTSGFCQRFENVTETSCLDIYGQHCLGLWFLLAESIFLEIFVTMMLMWKQ